GPTTIQYTTPHSLSRLWRRNLVDGTEAALTADSLRIIDYWLSPDRRLVALRLDRRDGTDDLAVLDLRTGTQHTISGNAWHGAVHWSPDGTRLMFAANPSGNQNVYVANAIGDPQPRSVVDWPSAET